MINQKNFETIRDFCIEKKAELIAVSKTKPKEDILDLYHLGHRHFGENYVQELVQKSEELPKDIHWHFIGHLQSNKVKYIAPFVHLIHGVDSSKLLAEINKQATKLNKKISVLLQIHIAQEETKFGLNETELNDVLNLVKLNHYPNTEVKGLMGMASFSNDETLIKNEFEYLSSLFKKYNHFFGNNPILSMGMSGDYKLAIDCGSNMIRVGSLLFGAR